MVERTDDPAFVDLVTDGTQARTDRAMVIRVEASDINCRRNITPKYGERAIQERIRLARAQLLEEITLLRQRNRELEMRLGGY